MALAHHLGPVWGLLLGNLQWLHGLPNLLDCDRCELAVECDILIMVIHSLLLCLNRLLDRTQIKLLVKVRDFFNIS